MEKESPSTSGAKISNFFSSTSTPENNNLVESQTKISQSFPISQNNPQQQSQDFNQNNSNQIPPQSQQIPSIQKTFFEKINSTATDVFDFIKNKTPALPTNLLQKKLLNKVDL